MNPTSKANQGMSVAAKNDLLFQQGINFNGLPHRQKRGIGLYWVNFEKEGLNPKTGQKTLTQRRKIHLDYDLPTKEAYGLFIEDFLKEE